MGKAKVCVTDRRTDGRMRFNVPTLSRKRGTTKHWLLWWLEFTLGFDPKYFVENFIKTRAPRGTDRSPEYNEHFCYKLDSRVKNLTTEWNQKQQHFITHASRSLLWIQFVAVAFRSEEEVFWRRGPPSPGDLFCLALDLPLGKYGQNIFMHVPGHEHFILPSFVNIH